MVEADDASALGAWITLHTEPLEKSVTSQDREETIQHTPHDAREVLDYFDGADIGHAISIDSYRRFDTPIPRTELIDAGHRPAQNFRYIGEITAHPEVVAPVRLEP